MHGLNEVTNRTGPIRILRTVLLIPDCLLDANRFPIHIEFIGNHKRQRCTAARAHLGSMRSDYDFSIRLEAEIDAWLPRRCSYRFVSRQTGAEHKRARGKDGAEKTSSIDCNQFEGNAVRTELVICLPCQPGNLGTGLRAPARQPPPTEWAILASDFRARDN